MPSTVAAEQRRTLQRRVQLPHSKRNGFHKAVSTTRWRGVCELLHAAYHHDHGSAPQSDSRSVVFEYQSLINPSFGSGDSELDHLLKETQSSGSGVVAATPTRTAIHMSVKVVYAGGREDSNASTSVGSTQSSTDCVSGAKTGLTVPVNSAHNDVTPISTSAEHINAVSTPASKDYDNYKLSKQASLKSDITTIFTSFLEAQPTTTHKNDPLLLASQIAGAQAPVSLQHSPESHKTTENLAVADVKVERDSNFLKLAAIVGDEISDTSSYLPRSVSEVEYYRDRLSRKTADMTHEATIASVSNTPGATQPPPVMHSHAVDTSTSPHNDSSIISRRKDRSSVISVKHRSSLYEARISDQSVPDCIDYMTSPGRSKPRPASMVDRSASSRLASKNDRSFSDFIQLFQAEQMMSSPDAAMSSGLGADEVNLLASPAASHRRQRTSPKHPQFLSSHSSPAVLGYQRRRSKLLKRDGSIDVALETAFEAAELTEGVSSDVTPPIVPAVVMKREGSKGRAQDLLVQGGALVQSTLL